MTTPTFPKQLDTFAGHSIAELAEQFGTPLFVYEAATIVDRIQEFAAFDVVRFAQKACSNLAILDLMRQHGVVVDAVSAGEIRRALAAGYRAGEGSLRRSSTRPISSTPSRWTWSSSTNSTSTAARPT